MAHGRPWYKRRGGDFITGTLHMPPVPRLCYSLIIDMLNDRDRPIPDDPGFIAGFCGISKQKWAAARRYLLADGSLLILPDGRISNPAFEREQAERDGEHQRAVDHGREGGKKSAALRAAGQTELPLDATSPSARARTEQPKVEQKLSKTSPISSNKVATNRAGSDREVEAAPSNHNDLAQPPRQAPYARKRLEDREEESSQPNPSHYKTASPALAEPDLLALHERVCEAAGYRPVNPTQVAASLDQVKDWRTQGLDFDATVIPAIEGVVAHSKDPTRTLGRFRGAVAHEHAKRKANRSRGTAHRKPDVPLLQPADEDPRFRPLRTALLQSVGPAAFCLAYNDARFYAEPVEFGEERNPLRVKGSDHVVETIATGNYRPHTLQAARPLGFTDVWKG